MVWFRKDLRLADHAPLVAALEAYEQIVPVYVLNPVHWRVLPLGFPKTGPFATRFLLESLADLQDQLRKKGSDLLLAHGEPERVLAQLALRWGATAVFATEEVAHDERQEQQQVSQALAAAGASLQLCANSTLFPPQDLPWPIADLPDVFTHFRKTCEKQLTVPKPLSAPDRIASPPLPDSALPALTDLRFESEMMQLDERSAFPFSGGATAAHLRMDHYFERTHGLLQYKFTRNELLGTKYSSKLSPWLALGCISPREIYARVRDFEKAVKANVSTYWLIFELIWRDYFHFVTRKYGSRIFRPSGIGSKLLDFSNDRELFEKWRTGQTGVPFIDANMRELLLTGFMSNRGRQLVASFLCKDLRVNWTWGAAWFESQLIDYDVCSNWGNWMYVAGVGNDPRENRYFNILTQAEKYDPKGQYVRQWLPELASFPGFSAHVPDADQLSALRITYPSPPLVPFAKWRAV